jgi:hypothetical protein
MIHLSLTGWGSRQERRLCQVPVGDGDTQWHAMYCSHAQLADPRVCGVCQRIWEEEEDEE